MLLKSLAHARMWHLTACTARQPSNKRSVPGPSECFDLVVAAKGGPREMRFRMHSQQAVSDLLSNVIKAVRAAHTRGHGRNSARRRSQDGSQPQGQPQGNVPLKTAQYPQHQARPHDGGFASRRLSRTSAPPNTSPAMGELSRSKHDQATPMPRPANLLEELRQKAIAMEELRNATAASTADTATMRKPSSFNEAPQGLSQLAKNSVQKELQVRKFMTLSAERDLDGARAQRGQCGTLQSKLKRIVEDKACTVEATTQPQAVPSSPRPDAPKKITAQQPKVSVASKVSILGETPRNSAPTAAAVPSIDVRRSSKVHEIAATIEQRASNDDDKSSHDTSYAPAFMPPQNLHHMAQLMAQGGPAANDLTHTMAQIGTIGAMGAMTQALSQAIQTAVKEAVSAVAAAQRPMPLGYPAELPRRSPTISSEQETAIDRLVGKYEARLNDVMSTRDVEISRLRYMLPIYIVEVSILA
eukprot:scaffold106_cov380-Prasinococcus_capsulatus_cf.AAC.53